MTTHTETIGRSTIRYTDDGSLMRLREPGSKTTLHFRPEGTLSRVDTDRDIGGATVEYSQDYEGRRGSWTGSYSQYCNSAGRPYPLMFRELPPRVKLLFQARTPQGVRSLLRIINGAFETPPSWSSRISQFYD